MEYSEAYTLGYNHFKFGDDSSTNPYEYGTFQYDQYNRGRAVAQEEAYDAWED